MPILFGRVRQRFPGMPTLSRIWLVIKFITAPRRVPALTLKTVVYADIQVVLMSAMSELILLVV